MTRAFHATDRAVLRISGADHRKFLQDLVTNNLDRLSDGPIYAALLTPQGKYLSDFFLISEGDDSLLLDTAKTQAAALVQRLGLYKLRAAVEIEETDLEILQGLGEVPGGAWLDPREPSLGWRIIVPDARAAMGTIEPLDPRDWEAVRIRTAVPASDVELIPGDSYILEMGFDRLHGVDFRKGCYVGQEVTARMRHKTELRKGLARVLVDGEVEAGAPITAHGKSVGTLHSVMKGEGLAYLRFDRAKGELWAGDARLSLVDTM